MKENCTDPDNDILFSLDTMEADKELEILDHIYHNQASVRQRDLAHIAGVSLGMINVILRRLAEKGWIKIRKINNRNIQYLVSPEGMEAISRRSYNFFKRTIKNLVDYKDVLEKLICDIKHRGYSTIVLVGPSQVDFVVEHFCTKYGLNFLGVNGSQLPETDSGSYWLFCEDIEETGLTVEHGTYLRDVLIGYKHICGM